MTKAEAAEILRKASDETMKSEDFARVLVFLPK